LEERETEVRAMMRWVICLMVIVVMFVVNGCGGGGGGADRTAPEISNPQVSPTKLRFVGGEVTISAVVRDPSGVERVWAVVQKPDGTSMEVSLSPAGGDSYRGTVQGDSYRGTVQVGSNTRDDGKSLVYRVRLRARDRNGNETPQPGVPTEGLSVEVTAPLNPPQQPSL
jgi:hypothetical protein